MTLSLFLAKGGLFDPIAKPLAATLAFLYDLVPNYGIAIVLLTIAMMIVLTPLTIKQTRSMLVMQKLQPEMKKLQDQHKNDRAALNEAVMALYKEHNASPLGGCLPMLLPFPLFIGLLQVLRGLSHTVKVNGVVQAMPKYLSSNTRIYKDIVKAGGKLDAFGMDLAKSARSAGGGFAHTLPFFLLLLLMIGTQFYQQYQLTSKNPAAKSQPGQAAMMKFIPLFFGLISLGFPAGVVLYWTVSNIIRIGQQWALYRYDPKVKALVVKDIKEIEAKTREIDAQQAKPTGRARFRDLLSNASDAAADRKGSAGKDAVKPTGNAPGDKTGAAGRGARTPPGKASTGPPGAKAQKPGTPASKASGPQRGISQKPGAPKAGGPKGGAPPLKPGVGKSGAPKSVRPAGSGPGGAPGSGSAAKGIQKAAPSKPIAPKGGPMKPPGVPKAPPTGSTPPKTNAAPAAAQPAAAQPAPAQPAPAQPAPAQPAAVSPVTEDRATAAPANAGAPAPPGAPAAPAAPSAAAPEALVTTAPAGPGATTSIPANDSNGAAAKAGVPGAPDGNGAGKQADDADDEGSDAPAGTGNGAPAKGRTGGGSARNVSNRRRRGGR